MAESSNPGGLGKQLFGAKNETIRGSKRKRKRGKKPAQTQSKESLESELKGQECSSVISDKRETVDNNEVSKMSVEQKSQTLEANDEKETANISEETNSRDNEKMAISDTKQADEINEEFMNKDGQQELEMTQEQRSAEQGSKPELAKPDQASYNKKRKLSLRGSKKVKLSKSQSSVEQDERGDILTSEAGAVDMKTADENAKGSCEKEVNQANAAKFDESDGLLDNENNDASKSPEGIKEKSGKNNKGKKLKQLTSFGRAKKKTEIAMKLETSNETCESLLDDGSVRSERSASNRSQDSQNMEIVDSVLEKPVAVAKSDLNKEHVNDERDEGTEIEKKEVAKEKKKKGSVLGFRRISKSNLGKRKSSKNEVQGAESSPPEKTSARKENDDVSITERVKNEDEFEGNKLEHKVEPKASETEKADLKPEETSGTEAEMTREASNKEEMNSAESKGNGVTKKEKKESILRRSLRKFKSPPKALQGNRKSYEDEKSAVTEVGKSVGDVQGKDELSEKAVREETPDQNASEESSALKEMENEKELEYLTEEKEKSVDEFNFHLNKDLSTQKNIIEEQKESKQSKVEEEISCETLARDDTQTEEEITKEVQEKCHKLMKTVIHELTEFIEKKEEERATENATQIEKREESVKFSHDENAPVESLQQTNAIDEADMEREAEDESYDSDVTVVTVKRLPSHELLIEHKTGPNSEDDRKSSETEAPEERQNEPILEHQAAEPNLEHQAAETETLHVTETQEEHDHETMPSTEDKEISASIEGTEPNEKDEEIRACTDEVSTETEAAQDIGSPDRYEIKPDLEEKEVPDITEEASLETEAPQVSHSRPDDEKVSITEDEELQATNDGVSSETETSEASKEESKLKGRVVEVKVLSNESEMNDESDELEPTTTENELDGNREDEGAEQQLENSSLMESFQTSSCQNSVEEWVLVHQLVMTEDLSRQIKHALMLNSLSPLRRTTACCMIM